MARAHAPPRALGVLWRVLDTRQTRLRRPTAARVVHAPERSGPSDFQIFVGLDLSRSESDFNDQIVLSNYLDHSGLIRTVGMSRFTIGTVDLNCRGVADHLWA